VLQEDSPKFFFFSVINIVYDDNMARDAGYKQSEGSKPTIYSLAREAGVSIATVSRALRDDPAVSPATRQQIQDLARQLGYRRSPLATRLAGGKTGMIAMVLPTVRNPFYAALAGAVMTEARKSDHEVLIAYAEIDAAHERHILETFRQAHVDGYIVVPQFWAENRDVAAALTREPGGRPVVVRDELDPDDPFDAIYVDMQRAACEATGYLIRLGHRRIAYLGYSTAQPSGGRPAGFAQAMQNAGLDVRFQHIGCGTYVEHACAAARQLLADYRPTALVVQSDYHAQGVLRAAAEMGLSVPRDLSVISFDGIELAGYGTVPLTTMAQPLDDVAAALVQCLLDRIKGDNSPPRRQLFPMRMIERNSTAPPP